LLRAIVIIYAARVLGAAGWGEFSYAVTLVAFLTIFIDFGINSVLVRETAKSPSDEERVRVLSTSFFMKSVLLSLGVLVVLFLVPHFVTLPGAKVLLPIVTLILVFDTLREFGFSLIRGLEKMEWETGIFLLTNAFIVVFGLLFLHYRPTVKSFTWGYVAGTLIGASAMFYTLRDYFKNLITNFTRKLIKPILKSAWPFAIAGALGMLLTNTDILIIGWLRTAEDVGYYSAALRIIQFLYLLPVILQVSTLPLFSRLAQENEGHKFRTVLERTISLIFLVSIPLALGGFILGNQIMSLIFGPQYLPGALSFKILMITMIIDFPATVLSAAIFAYNRQKSLIVTSALGGGFNILLDLILIPRFGITGSAFATLFAQFISNYYLWHVMNKINHFEVARYLKRVMASAFIMSGLSVIILSLGMNVIINVAVCMTLYFLMLHLMKEPLIDEMKLILRARTAEQETA